jgi:preprotein translocase subunit YajC
MQSLNIIIIYAAVLGVFWFLMVRPQKKKQQQLTQMRNALEVGDQVVTIGGIVGKVAVVKEDEIHLQIGHNQEVLVIKKWAVGSVSK